MAGEELLSAFKVASFTLEEDEEVSKLESITDENTKDWVRIPCYMFFRNARKIENFKKKNVQRLIVTLKTLGEICDFTYLAILTFVDVATCICVDTYKRAKV